MMSTKTVRIVAVVVVAMMILTLGAGIFDYLL